MVFAQPVTSPGACGVDPPPLLRKPQRRRNNHTWRQVARYDVKLDRIFRNLNNALVLSFLCSVLYKFLFTADAAVDQTQRGRHSVHKVTRRRDGSFGMDYCAFESGHNDFAVDDRHSDAEGSS